MALTVTGPALATSGYIGVSAGSCTSNSFTPPAGSVITVTSWAMDSYQDDWNVSYPTITDSLASHLTWNEVTAAYSNSEATMSQRVALWWAYTASAPGSMTATVSEDLTGGQYLYAVNVAVKIWGGANISAPVSNATVSGVTAAAQSVSQAITPTTEGSALLLAGGLKATATNSTTAGAGCYLADNSDATGNNMGGGQVWYGTSAGPTLTTGSKETLSIDDSSPAWVWSYIGYEIVPATTARGGLLVASFP